MPQWIDTILGDAHETLVRQFNPLSSSQRNEDAPVLGAHATGLAFLRGRGVTEAEIVSHNIGYVGSSALIPECPPDFSSWSQNFLRDCITFPIYSPTGEVIGTQIRILAAEHHTRPYKQYYCYHRDIFPYFFGLQSALPHIYASGYVIIVEGIFDYFAVRKVTPNVLSVLTSGVPVACKRFFNRFCKRVVAMLDMDNPGREGADRLVRDSAGMNYSVIVPTYSEKDPGELFAKGKMREIERIYSQTSSLLIPGNRV